MREFIDFGCIHRKRFTANVKRPTDLSSIWGGHDKILVCEVLKKISSLAYFCGFGNYFWGTV